MKSFIVPSVIVMHLFKVNSSVIACGRLSGLWIILCVKQHILNLFLSSIFSTLKSLYKSFVCDFRLNCRIFYIFF